MSVQVALARLQVEIEQFNPGTNQVPAPGTPEWFLMYAKTLGATYLKLVLAEGTGTPEFAQALYQQARASLHDPVTQ